MLKINQTVKIKPIKNFNDYSNEYVDWYVKNRNKKFKILKCASNGDYFLSPKCSWSFHESELITADSIMETE